MASNGAGVYMKPDKIRIKDNTAKRISRSVELPHHTKYPHYYRAHPYLIAAIQLDFSAGTMTHSLSGTGLSMR
jgi:hypothetical protein